MQKMSSETVTMEELERLSISEITEICRDDLKIPRAVMRLKSKLLAYVHSRGSVALHMKLRSALHRLSDDTEDQSDSKKRKRHQPSFRNVRRRIETEPDLADLQDTTPYLALPSEGQVKECYRQFFEATSNAAVEMVVCGVCARELNRELEKVMDMALEDLPNSERLIPRNHHEAHDLYNDRLLEPRGVNIDEENGRTTVNVCKSCLNELKRDGTKPPRYSLANDLWIGPIPHELAVLTFPEQLLISHLYP
jgi:hypothetical protein